MKLNSKTVIFSLRVSDLPASEHKPHLGLWLWACFRCFVSFAGFNTASHQTNREASCQWILQWWCHNSCFLCSEVQQCVLCFVSCMSTSTSVYWSSSVLRQTKNIWVKLYFYFSVSFEFTEQILWVCWCCFFFLLFTLFGISREFDYSASWWRT